MTPFGFTVEHPRTFNDDGERVVDDNNTTWRVYLPHQCDDWDIAGERYDAATWAEAVSELERFIAEANQALAALKAETEFDAAAPSTPEGTQP